MLVSTHQSNYAKILSLRAASQDLDGQIKDTLTLLTTTRSDLLSVTSTSFPDTTNPISYSELLSYARRISKFTLPSTYREPEAGPRSADARFSTSANTPKESKSGTQTNGSTSPVGATNGVDLDTQLMVGPAMDIDNGNGNGTPATGTQQPSQATNATSSTALPNEFSQWLNPAADLPFTPWPSEEIIRRGALASLQILTDKGIDPATFDPEKSAELEAERKRIMEEEDRLREEEKARIEEERRREMERRASISSGLGEERREARREEKPSVFQLETFDDDDED